MSNEDLSLFWGLWFLSLETWSFYHIDLSLDYVESHQGVLYYLWLLWNVLFPYFLSLPLYSSCVKKAKDLFELILYPATWLKLFLWFRSSLVEFLWSLKYTIKASANSDSLTSSFPICIYLIFFCFLVALPRPSSTILNK